jgi:Bacterial PH domain
METIFKAKLSKLSLAITVIVNAILLVVLFRIAVLKDYSQPEIYRYIAALGIIIALVLPHLIHPVSYTISPDGITINKILFSSSISIGDITEIKKVNYSDLFITIRLFGSGGLWGYFGIFYSTVYGKLNMQASNMQEMILISTTENKKYIISPENQQEFIDVLHGVKK